MTDNLKDKILKLKKEKNAVILAHYYQPAEIQDIADFVGDSYYLSKAAKDSNADVIVFCGVKFMAESAKILSPEKKVIMPCINAGCFMADMAAEKEIIDMKKKYKDAFTVCYINSTYKVKAHCDVTVTSSSAIKILKNINSKKILFLPDKNLGEYLSEFFPDKEFILWNGFCNCHEKIKKEDVLNAKEVNPDAEILAHPECTKDIRDIADYIDSTSGIIDYASKSLKNKFIICTEEGVIHELKKRNPNKEFIIPGGKIECLSMKKTTLSNLYDSLLNMENEIHLDENIRKKALTSLLNMHKLAESK
ncbi:quinolinate synthase NadA [Clostridium sp. BJN0001]|uniref:quinolinate synthase NadA n=1 Tax=Clostridium sp. BJN0001 TaxID=2930219 RepID=UPI001FD14F92|nr:quinolinate synthase NadA [Clostridium sp. BJN0001]